MCKAPTPWLKALNKHNIRHLMYIRMENVIHILTKANTSCTRQQGFKHNYVQDSHTHVLTHAHTHTHHTHILYRLIVVKDNVTMYT